MVQSVKITKMRCSSAFSLLELAIVIAIIGLLLGGVMATSSVLTSAKNKTLVNEGKLYLNAFKQFEQKYGGGKPGDIGNATSYWTAAPACPTVSGLGTTCNGNGDGSVQLDREIFLAFNHLSRAGLIPGSYTGNAGANNSLHGIVGTNLPSFSMEGVGGYFYTPSAAGYVTGSPYYDGYYGTALFIGASATNYLPQNNFLTAATLQEIDTKFDDGRANTGWIRPFSNYTNCVSGTDYLPTNPNIGCTIIMLNP